MALEGDVSNGAALALGLKIGGRIVAAVWVMVVAAIVATAGGSVYITRIDAQLTGAVEDIRGMRGDLKDLAEKFAPAPYLERIHDGLRQEDQRLQIQIDRMEARIAGTPYNGRGYSGKQ